MKIVGKIKHNLGKFIPKALKKRFGHSRRRKHR
jgi:hypothetical protein